MGTVAASARAPGSPGPAWASRAAGTATATEAARAANRNTRAGRDRRLPKLIGPLFGNTPNITKLGGHFTGSQRLDVRKFPIVGREAGPGARGRAAGRSAGDVGAGQAGPGQGAGQNQVDREREQALEQGAAVDGDA